MDTQVTSPSRPSFLSKPGGLKLALQETSHGPSIRMFSAGGGQDEEDAAMETSGGIIPMVEMSGDGSGQDAANLNMAMDPDASYVISANGTLRAGGFVINKGGIASQPERRMSNHTSATASSSSSAAARGSFSGNSAQPSVGGGYSSLSAAFSTTDGELAFNPKDLVELGAVGKGACGVVKRAMHLPSLQVVALKQINVFDKDKRHQLVKELTALSAVNSP